MTRCSPPRTRAHASLAIGALLLFAACGGTADRTPAGTIDTAGAAADTASLRMAAIADSLSDGNHLYRDPRGRPLMEGRILGGKRQGVWTSYLPSGRVKSRNVYENGVLNGITTVYHTNGVLYYSGEQRRGKPFGEWKFYDDQGNLMKTAVYDTTGSIILNDKRGK